MANWLLDAGHGGSDPGATYNGRRECDDVLRLTLRVGEILKANGESVSYTRTGDTTLSLSDRSNMDNRGNYNYYVSMHRNAVGPEVARGVETYLYNGSFASKETCRSLASHINSELVKVGFPNRGVKEANFHVLRETKSNAVLTEVGFIDHSQDNALFDAKFEEIATAIAKGCLAQVGKTLGSTPSKPTPPPVPENIDVTYQLYTGGRWLPNVKNLQDYAGIYGQASQAVYASLSKGSIRYRVHTTSGRWLPFVTDRTDYAGIYGSNIDAVEFELVGLPGYSVKYRTYSRGRWLPWVIDRTDYAGIFGQAIEGLQVQIIKK